MSNELQKVRDYLREKNEIIKAFAGPTGMTPEDVRYALLLAVQRANALQTLLTAATEAVPFSRCEGRDEIAAWIERIAKDALRP